MQPTIVGTGPIDERATALLQPFGEVIIAPDPSEETLISMMGEAIGLDGVILLAYVIAIPANEIVVPTMLMVYMGVSMMSDLTSYDQIRSLLVDQHGWTMLTAVNLMLFSVLHNPCATTILTIWRETRSRKWTAVGALMPLVFAFLVTFAVATLVRTFG